MKRGVALLALLLAGTLHAATFRATVTWVVDGDTLRVRPAGSADTVTLRLLDLDAPEKCQAFGPQARELLRNRLGGKTVLVRTHGTDDYGRQLARVEYRGEDVGRWLVRNGYAWSMRFHGRSGPYAPLEALARDERKGLWGGADVLEPRRFRQLHGPCE
jgi:endonuclease YncB( thermonuclease family)